MRWAMGLGMLLLCAPAGAEAAVVFSNYDGTSCFCGSVNIPAASQFTPSADFALSGIALFLGNDGAATSVTFSLFDSLGGKPGTLLWTSTGQALAAGTVSEPTQALVTADYAGAPLVLDAGTPYFVSIDLAAHDVTWLVQGVGAVPTSFFFGSWGSTTGIAHQFEVYGDAVADTPEPASLALLSMSLLGLALRRR